MITVHNSGTFGKTPILYGFGIVHTKIVYPTAPLLLGQERPFIAEKRNRDFIAEQRTRHFISEKRN